MPIGFSHKFGGLGRVADCKMQGLVNPAGGRGISGFPLAVQTETAVAAPLVKSGIPKLSFMHRPDEIAHNDQRQCTQWRQ